MSKGAINLEPDFHNEIILRKNFMDIHKLVLPSQTIESHFGCFFSFFLSYPEIDGDRNWTWLVLSHPGNWRTTYHRDTIKCFVSIQYFPGYGKITRIKFGPSI